MKTESQRFTRTILPASGKNWDQPTTERWWQRSPSRKGTVMKRITQIAVAVIVGLLAAQSFWWATAKRAPSAAAPAVALPTASGPQAVALLKQHQLYDSL